MQRCVHREGRHVRHNHMSQTNLSAPAAFPKAALFVVVVQVARGWAELRVKVAPFVSSSTSRFVEKHVPPAARSRDIAGPLVSVATPYLHLYCGGAAGGKGGRARGPKIDIYAGARVA